MSVPGTGSGHGPLRRDRRQPQPHLRHDGPPARAGAELVSFYADEADLAPIRRTLPPGARGRDAAEILEDASLHLIAQRRDPQRARRSASRRCATARTTSATNPASPRSTNSRKHARCRRTGRIYSICYSERFQNRATVQSRRTGPGGRHRPTAADRRPRSASTERADRRPLVLRTRALRRHPHRHRLPPGRPVPVLHRLHLGRGRRRASREPRAPRVPGPRGFRRHTPARQQRQRLHPRRLVHAGRPAAPGATDA